MEIDKSKIHALISKSSNIAKSSKKRDIIKESQLNKKPKESIHEIIYILSSKYLFVFRRFIKKIK